MKNVKGNIGVIGREKMVNIIRDVSDDPNYGYFQFTFFEDMFDEAFKKINEVINSIDVFISGHTHCKLLHSWFPGMPLVLIKPLPFDTMLAIREAAKIDKIVYVINSYKALKLEQVKEIMREDIQICQYKFTNTDYLNDIFSLIKQKGGKVVVGGSLVCDIAPSYGLKALYYYSEQAVKEAIEEAANLLLVKMDQKAYHEKLKNVMDLSTVGIMVLGENQKIEYINRMAIQLLGLSDSVSLGIPVRKVLPDFELAKTNMEHTIVKINGEALLMDVVTSNDGSMIYRFQEIKRVERASLEIRKHMLSKPKTAKYTFGDILGSGLQPTIEIAKSYALSSDADILITGPTGSGKELFASSIHNSSSRAEEPFVPVNCAALPENLLESELFGYESGAFTGARKQGKRGLIELAHKGTLFLDEIGDMPYPVQAKLLRVLQEKEVLHVGGESLIPVDIRVIAATNRRLDECVLNNSFRVDLYYRLSKLILEIPPLSIRRQDIIEIIEYFLDVQSISGFTQEVIKNVIVEYYKDYEWPGNVRELLNVLERVVTFLRYTKKKDATIKELMIDLQNLLDSTSNKRQLFINTDLIKNTHNLIFTANEKKVTEINPNTIEKALTATGGNKTKAAKLLGISRSTLWRLSKGSI